MTFFTIVKLETELEGPAPFRLQKLFKAFWLQGNNKDKSNKTKHSTTLKRIHWQWECES